MKISVILIVCFFCLHGYSQQPALSVQRFEYIWQPNADDAFKRLILASNDTIKQMIEKSFANALQQRWELSMPQNVLSAKPVSVFSFSDAPKFNTKIKNKQPGVWYLFLQIFDKEDFLFNYNIDSSVSARLALKCKLINGSNDSVILDRNLSVKIYKEVLPQDQVVVAMLPAYPAHFARAFDSIATWLFQPECESEKSLWLKPACVFIDTQIPANQTKALFFKSDDKHIELLTEPAFAFQMPGTKYKKTDVRHRTGGNIATGAATIFTGLNLNKARVFEYNADFAFEENDAAYHCIVGYAEKETAERERETTREADGSKSYSLSSKSYALDERRAIPNFSNVITLNTDTLATFEMSYITNAKERKNYKRFWDGTDSSTITVLPDEWNNKWENDNVTITGKMNGSNFSMKTINERIIKEFYIDEKLVMIMYGKTYPVKALLFQPLSMQQVKVFAILSSLPYAYFNYPD